MGLGAVVKTYEVVMATCNGERFVDEQIVCILQQTVVPQRLLVADDHSSDRTLQRLRYWQQHSSVPIELLPLEDLERLGSCRNFERLLRPVSVARGALLAPGGYGFTDARVAYTFGLQRPVSGAVSLRQGAFYDGNLTTLTVSAVRLGLGPRLSFEPSLSLNHGELPAGAFTTTVGRVRGDIAFTTRMFATGLVQYGSADRGLSSNLRFRWEYRPGSEFFAVYTDERDMAPRALQPLKNRAFVLKINRLLRF